VGFFIGLNICMAMYKQKELWTYESPDQGKTVYRRKMGQPHDRRQMIDNEDFFSVQWIYNQHWVELQKNPAVRDCLDRLKVMVELAREE